MHLSVIALVLGGAEYVLVSGRGDVIFTDVRYRTGLKKTAITIRTMFDLISQIMRCVREGWERDKSVNRRTTYIRYKSSE